MAKKNKAVANAKGKTATNGLKAAKSELSFQQGIERMQLALKLGRYDVAKIVERGKLEFERIKALSLKLRENGVIAASNYGTLRDIYVNDLAHLTEQFFIDEALFKVERFMKKSAYISAEQAEIIEQFHDAQAKANYRVIANIQNILVAKGVLKVADAVKEPVEADEPVPADNDGDGLKQELK